MILSGWTGVFPQTEIPYGARFSEALIVFAVIVNMWYSDGVVLFQVDIRLRCVGQHNVSELLPTVIEELCYWNEAQSHPLPTCWAVEYAAIKLKLLSHFKNPQMCELLRLCLLHNENFPFEIFQHSPEHCPSTRCSFELEHLYSSTSYLCLQPKSNGDLTSSTE